MESERYYTELTVAFVRGKLPHLPDLSSEEIIRAGLDRGLRLHKFKRNTELPRVRRALGILRGLQIEDLLDVGSGRGTFLWPLLDGFPELRVTSIDIDPRRASDIDAVRLGGIENLNAVLMDAACMGFPDHSFDAVTILEVLEHLSSPERAAAEAIRVARRFVLLSVPSKEDFNPEHIHLFDKTRLEDMLYGAGAKTIKFEFVLNHIIALAKV
ncbi:MAG: class I SAM-dependent methyltransferase [Blastocatellia bacterium]|nr:class I SAM-dependent methyltransferase [Blastocatellia bacterium]